MKLDLDTVTQRYAKSMYTAAFAVCRNWQDAEDAVQEALLRYYTSEKDFASDEHVRAWLLRVAINLAKNATAAFWRRNKLPLDDYLDTLAFEEPSDRDLVEAVMALPERYRTTLHLHYFEGYSVAEIAQILRLRPGSVKSRLSRGRSMLREALREEMDDDSEQDPEPEAVPQGILGT